MEIVGSVNMTEQEVEAFLTALDKEHPWQQIQENEFPQYESCEAVSVKYVDYGKED